MTMLMISYSQFNWTEYVVDMFEDIPEVSITESTHVIVNDLAYIKSLSKIFANTSEEDIGKYIFKTCVSKYGANVTFN
jgi:hypothetical protein